MNVARRLDMDVTGRYYILNENNSYGNLLICKKHLNVALGVSLIVGSTLAKNMFPTHAAYLTIGMLGALFLGKSIGINTALKQVTSSTENRINAIYSIHNEELLSLCDEVFWKKACSIGLFTVVSVLTMYEILDLNSEAVLMGGTAISCCYGEADGINYSLKAAGLPSV